MTEKRFTIDEDGNITDTINDRCLYVENRMTECDYFVKLLNEQYEDLMTCHSYLSSKTNVENENAELRKENEQLKKRNKNQYNQLNELWELIEAKDYETLEKMVKQMEEDAKQLQREWRNYGDV